MNILSTILLYAYYLDEETALFKQHGLFASLGNPLALVNSSTINPSITSSSINVVKSEYRYSYLYYVELIDNKLNLDTKEKFSLLAKELLTKTSNLNTKTRNIIEEYVVDGLDSELNDIFFTGKVFDKEIGLYYFNARYYSPELGRFVNRDPIGIVDDVNLYVYVGNNPLKWVDPTGLKAKDLFVKTYDEFLDLESKIFNWDGTLDWSFIMLT